MKDVSNDPGDDVVTTYTVDASSEVANGIWKLRVRDVFRQDIGALDSWAIQF